MPDLRDLQRQVHLWSLTTATFDERNGAFLAKEVLSEAEQHRADRFAFEKDRRSYLAAHWLIRRVLSEYVPVPPKVWEFEQSLLGKPRIASPIDGASLQFNLSHSTGMVACAVTCLGEIGVDVESVHERDFLCLARRFFAPGEVSQLESLSIEQRTHAFFRLWTLKEAYLKARGLGLSVDLAGFGFPNVMGEEIRIEFAEGFDDDPAGWRFFRHEPDSKHKIAAAVNCPPGCDLSWNVFSDIRPFLQ